MIPKTTKDETTAALGLIRRMRCSSGIDSKEFMIRFLKNSTRAIAGLAPNCYEDARRVGGKFHLGYGKSRFRLVMIGSLDTARSANIQDNRLEEGQIGAGC